MQGCFGDDACWDAAEKKKESYYHDQEMLKPTQVIFQLFTTK
jgi:hypothetical protein